MKHFDLLEILAKCKKENIRSSMHQLDSFQQGFAIREYLRLDNIENLIKVLKNLYRRR